MKIISDILTWVQAFSVFVAILVSADSTSKDEAAGLAAHAHLIIQLSKDLGGAQWLSYDLDDFREWATAKGVQKWGELNFAIYGCCLASQQAMAISGGLLYKSKMKRKAADLKTCFKWNDGLRCESFKCRFAHCCSFCGENHCRVDCSHDPKWQ